ncbi:sensor histidine kinase [Pasteurellaceae bacterium 22721_9_1]
MKKCGLFLKSFILFCTLLPSILYAQEWRIGILAQRGVSHAHTTWQPWIDWLNQQLPEQYFSLVTLDLNDLEQEQAQGVDFILTNQAQFFYLKNNNTVRWLVTLMSPRQIRQHSRGRIGSAIFVRQDSDFKQLSDLKSHTISAVGKNAFGGFLLGYNEFYQQGLIENKDFKLVFTGFPVDNTLLLLQEKKVDGAIVPVCIFEELVKEGTIKSENFRLLDSKTNDLDCLASTVLLPNWSLAAMPQVPESLAAQLVRLLLSEIPPHLPQWTPPYSTSQADSLLRQLHKHPQQNLWDSLRYWFYQYRFWIIIIVLLLILNYLWIRIQIYRKSKALQTAYEEMRQYEQQLIQADRLSILGEMSAGIAHEINQPLSAIRMYVEGVKYLPQLQQDKKSMEILDKILNQVDKTADIIRNLMDWVKRKNNENIECIELKKFLQRTIHFMTLQHSAMSKIQLSCPEKLKIRIQPTLLEQILCNCLLNASQAHSSQIHIVVNPSYKKINIHILDNGTGFSDTELRFPFVPFRSSKNQGLGLGLVLCQRLIHTIGGDIHLQNRQDKQGAEVILTLVKEEKCRSI